MLGDVALFLASWLLIWALLLILYVGVIETADCVRSRWSRYQQAWRVALELARIDDEAGAAVHRIIAAYQEAGRQLRTEKARRALSARSGTRNRDAR